MKKERLPEFYFLCFFAYSVLGWCYEVFLEVIVYRWGFSNRGFLFGPYCPVYGFGALLLIGLLGWLRRKRLTLGRVNISPILVFLSIIALTTLLELGTSYLLEAVTGSWLWDYSTYPANFQGRIALNPSFRFGVGGMIFLYVLQPLFERADRLLSDKARRYLFIVCFGIMALDFLVKVI